MTHLLLSFATKARHGIFVPQCFAGHEAKHAFPISQNASTGGQTTFDWHQGPMIPQQADIDTLCCIDLEEMYVPEPS